jgi:hypothetical protein
MGVCFILWWWSVPVLLRVFIRPDGWLLHCVRFAVWPPSLTNGLHSFIHPMCSLQHHCSPVVVYSSPPTPLLMSCWLLSIRHIKTAVIALCYTSKCLLHITTEVVVLSPSFCSAVGKGKLVWQAKERSVLDLLRWRARKKSLGRFSSGQRKTRVFGVRSISRRKPSIAFLALRSWT